MGHDDEATIVQVVEQVVKFDVAAGHETNLSKSAFQATDPKVRKILENVITEGTKMKCKRSERNHRVAWTTMKPNGRATPDK